MFQRRKRSFHTNQTKDRINTVVDEAAVPSPSDPPPRPAAEGVALEAGVSGYRLRVVRREKRREFFRGEVLPLQEESESLPLVWAWTWARDAPAAISSLDSFFRICSSRSCCMSTCGHSWALGGRGTRANQQ